MPYKLSYFTQVKTDVLEAKKWYFGIRRGLEKRFATDVKRTLSSLKSNPHIHAIRYKKNRIARTEIFPYSIHFYIDDTKNRIVIIGIVHNNRNTDFLNQREEHK